MSSNKSAASAHKPSTEVIAGAITGGVVGVLLIALTSFFLLRLKRMKSERVSATQPKPNPMEIRMRDPPISPFVAPQQSTSRNTSRRSLKDQRRMQPATATSSAAPGSEGSHSITIPPSSVNPSQTDSNPRGGDLSSSGDSAAIARTQQRLQELEEIVASFAAVRSAEETREDAPPSYMSAQAH